MKKLVIVWSLMIVFCCSIALAQSNTVLLVDFGATEGETTYGISGWSSPIIDRYTVYSDLGPDGTTTRSDNLWYNRQGVQGPTRAFVAGDIIRVTWYNDLDTPLIFTPYISFTDEGRIAPNDMDDWHVFPETVVQPKSEATSDFAITAATAGTYSLVNINSHVSGTYNIVADKIELITDSDVPTGPPQDPPPQDPPVGNPGSCVHEADTVCEADGEDECGLSEKELRAYARKVLKRQKSLLDLVAAVQVFLNLETLCPGTHQNRGEGGGQPPEEGPGPVCGNGDVETGEQCDDGNTANGDGCSSTCATEQVAGVCGDGAVNIGEQCDDSNTNSGDGCSSTCQYESSCGTEECPAESFLGSNSVVVDGEAWTFRTAPPADLTFRTDHPRLLLNPEDIQPLKDKLADPVYTTDLTKLRSKADLSLTKSSDGVGLANALLYIVEDDPARLEKARQYLLNGQFDQIKGMDASGAWDDPVFVYDLIFNELTDQEKRDIFALIKDNYKYDEGIAKEIEKFEFYWNDEWARHRQMHIPILALAIKDEGIDDAWADDIINKALNEQDGAIGPYGGITGRGILDGLMSLSLDDGGGKQAGSYGSQAVGYYSMFGHSILPIIAWDSATSDDLWPKINFYRKVAGYWAYDKVNHPSGFGATWLEINTGVYKDVDPDEAALSKWMLDKHGKNVYLYPYRLALGDLRTQAKSPTQLNLPEAKYIKGADMFSSSDSWADDALTVIAYARYMDTSRYEPSSGIFSITRGQEPYTVPGEHNKQPTKVGTYSGMVIQNKATGGKPYGQDMTYWNVDGNYPSYDNVKKIRRVKNPLDAMSKPEYFPGGPDVLDISDNKRVMSVEYARLVAANGAKKVRRTIAHLVEPDRNFVVVYDYTDLTSDLTRAWQLRLATEPTISGSDFSIPGMHGTIVSPQSPTIEWVGGHEREHLLPAPDYTYYSNGRGGTTPGYSSHETRGENQKKRWGLGNLYIQKANEPTVMEHLVVMEITDGAKTSVTRISDSSASFGKWTVDFNLDGSYSITEN